MTGQERPRLVLAGGRGFLGGVLADYFTQRGWDVVIFTRSPREGIRSVREIGWDGQTLDTWTEELENARAVVNLCGVSVNCRYTTRNRKRIMDSRLLPTHILGEAIVRCANPPHVWINASTATIYRHTFGAAWDESGEIAATREAKDEFSVQVATEWERALNSFRTPRTRKLLLRSAMVLGTARNSVFPALRRLVRLGLGGSLAGGRQFVSWIHERDFCGAVDWLIEHHDLDGAFNVSSPMPVTNAEMMRALREVCGRHIGLPTSRLMLELGAVFLRTETELIIKSRWVVPGRLLGSGFEFQFPEIQRALQDLEGNWVPVASGPARGHFPN